MSHSNKESEMEDIYIQTQFTEQDIQSIEEFIQGLERELNGICMTDTLKAEINYKIREYEHKTHIRLLPSFNHGAMQLYFMDEFLDGLVGWKLKRVRLIRDVTLTEASDYLGIPLDELEAVEDGIHTGLSFETLEKYCNWLDYDVWALCYGDI